MHVILLFTLMDGVPASMLPGGGLTQLDPALAINTAWDAWQKMLVRTLQIHGAYVGDNGGSAAI